MSETPAVIGRYEVERQLGEGGMGVLYLARDPVLDRHVALKLLRVDSVDLRRRFVREAQSAARIQHPNIVTVYDVGDHDGQLYIAMEYIDGDTLAVLIRDDVPFSAIRKLDIVDEIADGLGFAHQRGIIHRDIKPANLMITRGGLVKVLDFGIARIAHKQSGEMDAPTLVGTPAYMAPEQLEGAEADARCDIYAVGLVMYELFSGRRAFAGATTADVLQLVLEARPTPLETLVPDVDVDLARVVARAMARQPEDRYPDLQAMRKDLARARRRALQASADDATIVVGMPAIVAPRLPATPLPPTRAEVPGAAPVVPPAPAPASPAAAPRPATSGSATTAEDAVLARLAKERSGPVRATPTPPPADDGDATIFAPVASIEPPAGPAPAPPRAATAPPHHAAPPPMPSPVRASEAAAANGDAVSPVVPPPVPVPLPSVPAGAPPRRAGGITADAPAVETPAASSPPRRSSPPRAPVGPAAAPLAPAPVPVGPPAASAVSASLPSMPAAPAAASPQVAQVGPAVPAGPPASVPSPVQSTAGARTTAPLPTARRGVPAAAIVGGLVALLAVAFIGAFLAVRALGLFEGPSLLTRLWPAAGESKAATTDPPPVETPPAAVTEPTPSSGQTSPGQPEPGQPGQAEPTATTATEPGSTPGTEPATSTEVPVEPVPVAPTVATPPPVATRPPVAPPARTGPKALPPSQRPTVPTIATRTPPVATPPVTPPRVEAEEPRREEPPREEPRRQPEVVAPREEAMTLVRAYVAARNTSHAGGIRRVWPSVDDVHLRRITSSFSAPLTLSGCSVDTRGDDQATASCQLTQPGTTGVYAQGQGLTIRRTFVFDLARQGRTWVITGLRE